MCLAAAHPNLGSPKFLWFVQNLIGLTDDQTQDMILIQHLYMTRRASLDKQRKAIVERMGAHEQQGFHPADGLVALSVLAEQAQDVTAQDFQAYCTVLSALYQGVMRIQYGSIPHRATFVLMQLV